MGHILDRELTCLPGVFSNCSIAKISLNKFNIYGQIWKRYLISYSFECFCNKSYEIMEKQHVI